MSRLGVLALTRLLRVGKATGVWFVGRVRSGIRRARSPVSVVVVIADRRHRRQLRRRLHAGVRQLQGAFGEQPLIVVAQERLVGGQSAGSHLTYRWPDGTTGVVIRLALTLEQHRLTVDELLASLVDEYVAVHAPGASAAGLGALFADLGAARDGVHS